ncbi:hypothetical protein J2Z28_005898 [Paenibacillus xylanexedens]|uniref:Uncharacterized protein n=1 Tax=Paenibacillus xylanexedens TaxID=528191 RepID=A0ABS4S247_PAEXY|nr:hypothetical protein [Paenibacillus xylanexedens]
MNLQKVEMNKLEKHPDKVSTLLSSAHAGAGNRK